MAFELACIECGASYDNSTYRLFCSDCNGLLDARYDTPKSKEARIINGKSGFAKHLPMLPIRDPSNLVTMNEGDTPIVPLSKVGQTIGVKRLYGKVEYFNPTGSFKDRGNAILVSVLKDTGITAVVESTGGNGGNSFAAYCARGDVVFHAFMNQANFDSPKAKAIAIHGSRAHWVEGSKQDVYDAAKKFAEDTGVLHLRYGKSTYFIEGQKTMAYEIPNQLETMPDHVVIPTGNGSILMGMYKGFKEMLEDGRINHMPRLHAVQTEETAPLVAAFEQQNWESYVGEPKSKANGISVKDPPRPRVVASACRESGGSAIAVPEESVLLAQKQLAELEGILIEPASSAALAGVQSLRESGRIGAHDSVLLPLTGFGIKEPIP